MPPQTNGNGSAGSLIAIIVVLALVIVGALFFWQRSDDSPETAGTEESMESITTQSDSDATTDIEADLNATDIDSLDAELNF